MAAPCEGNTNEGGAAQRGSRQDKAAVTVASGMALRLLLPPLPLLWRQTFHLCKVIEVICRKGRDSERASEQSAH